MRNHDRRLLILERRSHVRHRVPSAYGMLLTPDEGAEVALILEAIGGADLLADVIAARLPYRSDAVLEALARGGYAGPLDDALLAAIAAGDEPEY